MTEEKKKETKELVIKVGNLFVNPRLCTIIFVAESGVNDFKPRTCFVCKNNYGDITVVENLEEKHFEGYVEYKSLKLKRELKMFYTTYRMEKFYQEKIQSLRSGIVKSKKEINDLIQEDFPTIKVLVEKVGRGPNCEITSYSCQSEGSITITQSKHLGRHRYDLVVREYEPRLKVTEESLIKEYAPPKTTTNFKHLKTIKLNKVENEVSIGDEASVYINTSYDFNLKLTKKNHKQALEEVQWIMNNL